MSKIDRLSENDSDASELERSVLRADQGMQPPMGAEAVVWSKLSAELGLPASLGIAALDATSPTAHVPAAASSLGFVKGVVVGVLASGALWQGHRWLSAPEPHTNPPAQQANGPAARPSSSHKADAAPPASVLRQQSDPPRPTLPPSARAASPVIELQRTTEPSGAPSVAGFADENPTAPLSPEQRASRLKEEASLLRQARAQLRAGDLAGASSLLVTSGRRFSMPELYQEREALAIELLYRSGQTAAAITRAQAFLATFPESPHAARLRSFAAPP